jgi:hypothetical protein
MNERSNLMRRNQAVEQQQQQGPEARQSWAEKLGEWIKDNHDRQPSLGAELKAMGREAIKDVRNTVHEVFFGQREGPGEPGAPLNYTQAEISQDRGLVGGYQAMLDAYASRGSVHGQEQDKALER